MEENTKQKPGSSFIPVLLIGLMIVLGIQLFSNKEEKTGNNNPNPGPDKETPKPINQPVNEKIKTIGNDFQFKKSSVAGKHIEIDTGNHYILLNAVGARIEKFYVKKSETVSLPQTVIQKSKDPIEVEKKAIEITRGNGMDFQFHLYFQGPNKRQLARPPLNRAAFKHEYTRKNKEAGLTEVSFLLTPVRFHGHRLAIRKIYRFINGENFFRQITVLRNLEKNEFRLQCPDGKHICDMYFKPFSDLGPAPEGKEDSRTLASYGRFFYYGDELVVRHNSESGSGSGCSMLPFGCSSPDAEGAYTLTYNNLPNALQLAGTNSRYLLAYNDFMSQNTTPVNQPDGLVYKNSNDIEGLESFTAAFHRFRLSANKVGKLNLGGIDRVMKSGKFVGKQFSNQAVIESTQQDHNDALIVNNRVYVGIRTSNAHSFSDPERMVAEFGSTEPNENASDALYSNAFYAFFAPIQAFIVKIMHLLYKVVGNYGWCIIIIAVSFKLATFPLNQIQARSMKKMSALKPQIEKLNLVYADNAQEKQKKLMELYRKEGVNPAKGCLPIVIQMPVFFALYSAFSESIELWGSPFIFWITDLSKPDTLIVIESLGNFNLNILPLLMVITQILNQHFTQMTVDPQQKMMMYFMPVMMLFFFWQFPSGVTLYWIVQNVISVIWQLAVNKEKTIPLPAAK